MVAYPGLTLVERGNWGEAVRRMVDGRLPWLPHRSRVELARLFRVKVAAQNDETVQLEFALPGAPDGEILVTVLRTSGLPIKWESRLDGQITMRLRFENLKQRGATAYWHTVIAEDDLQHELERWELVGYDDLKSEIPPLAESWNKDLMFDVRDQELVNVPPVMRLLQAARLRDWKSADAALATALANQPDQPFLLLVKAWTLSQRAGDHSPEIVALLAAVGRQWSMAICSIPFRMPPFFKLGGLRAPFWIFCWHCRSRRRPGRGELGPRAGPVCSPHGTRIRRRGTREGRHATGRARSGRFRTGSAAGRPFAQNRTSRRRNRAGRRARKTVERYARRNGDYRRDAAQGSRSGARRGRIDARKHWPAPRRPESAGNAC